jgi:bacterioferritin (cytochrome b1)
MEHSFDFLAQPLSDNGLRAEQETMEHNRETILQTEHAAEFARATKLIDAVAQEEHHEADLKDALGLGLWLLL